MVFALLKNTIFKMTFKRQCELCEFDCDSNGINHSVFNSRRVLHSLTSVKFKVLSGGICRVKLPKPPVVKFYLLFPSPKTSKDIQGVVYRSAGTFLQEIIVCVHTLPLSCRIYD